MRGRTLLLATLAAAVIAALALVAVASAGGATGSPVKSATPVFKVHLKPSQEVPPNKGLQASARGTVTFDLTRDAQGVITSGEVVFYVNYRFSGPVTITGLHIHVGARGTNGPVVVNSGVTTVVEPDGTGNITTVVTGTDPALLQAIIADPRDYYVNLHTTEYPGGALREQLHRPVKF